MTRNADWNLNSTPWTFDFQATVWNKEGGAAAPLNSKTGGGGGCVRSLEAGKHTKGQFFKKNRRGSKTLTIKKRKEVTRKGKPVIFVH